VVFWKDAAATDLSPQLPTGLVWHKGVKVLEKVRGEYLRANELGKFFVSAHYKYSPALAAWIAKHLVIRKVVRIGLCPIVELSKWLVGENPSK
jgi:hypothetical protein